MSGIVLSVLAIHDRQDEFGGIVEGLNGISLKSHGKFGIYMSQSLGYGLIQLFHVNAMLWDGVWGRGSTGMLLCLSPGRLDMRHTIDEVLATVSQ